MARGMNSSLSGYRPTSTTKTTALRNSAAANLRFDPFPEANRCNLRHVAPKTLQKALYVGFSQISRPLQVVWFGWSRFPIPAARLAGYTGSIYGLTPCGCGEVHRLADRLLLILLGSARRVVNEVSVVLSFVVENLCSIPHPLGSSLRDLAFARPRPRGIVFP